MRGAVGGVTARVVLHRPAPPGRILAPQLQGFAQQALVERPPAAKAQARLVHQRREEDLRAHAGRAVCGCGANWSMIVGTHVQAREHSMAASFPAHGTVAAPRSAAPELVPHWVGGAPLSSSGARLTVLNPATGAPLRELALAGAAEVDAAVASAQEAWRGWADTPPVRRARILSRFLALLNAERDALAALITAEHGKVFADAQGEVTRGIEIVEFACGIPQLLKGDFTDQVSTGIDNWTCDSRWGWSPASRRSTFRAWCRAGCFRSRWRAATPSCSSRASATRRPRSSWRGCWRQPACRRACSTWCRGTRAPSMRCSITARCAR